MYRVFITENAGVKEIVLSEGEEPQGRILKEEVFDDMLAAKKRYHMLRTYDEAMLEGIASSDSVPALDPGECLDEILGRKPALKKRQKLTPRD